MAIMNLTALLTSGVLIVFGVSTGHEWYALSGAILFLLLQVIGVLSTYHVAKLFRTGAWEPQQKNFVGTLSEWIKGVLILGGLFLILTLASFTTGIIIWFGSIACWFISGVIAREVAGIPVRMGYGGWKVHRPPRRR